MSNRGAAIVRKEFPWTPGLIQVGFLSSRQIPRRVTNKPSLSVIKGGGPPSPLHSISRGWQTAVAGAAQVLESYICPL